MGSLYSERIEGGEGGEKKRIKREKEKRRAAFAVVYSNDQETGKAYSQYKSLVPHINKTTSG